MTRDKVWIPKASTTFGTNENIREVKTILGYIFCHLVYILGSLESLLKLFQGSRKQPLSH